MKLQSVYLQWFRGASLGTQLNLGGKSVAVFGCNGAGKSSFVDAIEYIANGSKIQHLVHEHSGRNQYRGIVNTHKPTGALAQARVTFTNGAKHEVDFPDTGIVEHRDLGGVRMQDWPCAQIVLRHAQLAAFISSTKNEKYNALVPLLGLQGLDFAAENIKRIHKALQVEIKARFESTVLAAADARRRYFENQGIDAVKRKLQALYALHVGGAETEDLERARALGTKLKAIVDAYGAQRDQYNQLGVIAGSTIVDLVLSLQALNLELAQESIDQAKERAAVVAAADSFVAGLPDAIASLPCPACGTSIQAAGFRAHIELEKTRLARIMSKAEQADRISDQLASAIGTLARAFWSPELRTWRELEGERMRAHVESLVHFAESANRRAFDARILSQIQQHAGEVICLATRTRGAEPQQTRD